MSERTKLPAITPADVEPARLLLMELETQIATQRLHYRAGDEESAARSLHELFPKTRGFLGTHWQAAAFATAAIFLLNRLLRPNTARWHRWMVAEKFADERARRQFRYELQQLQPRLAKFAALLELIAQQKAEAGAAFDELIASTPSSNRPACLGGKVRAGIAKEVALKSGMLHPGIGSESFATAEEIDAAEHRAIRARRHALDPQAGGEEAAPLENVAGLCLSGGGIRSATFCLGIVQVLAREGLLARFDYLSTVSGGGYLGAFLSSYLGTPPAGAPAGIRETINAAFTAEGGRESAAVRHLRNNSRYLLSGGMWGRLKMFGLLITGIFTNVLLMLPLPLVAVLGTGLLFAAGYWTAGWTKDVAPMRGTPAFLVFSSLGMVLLAGWLALPAVRNFARGAPHGSSPAKLRTLWESVLVILGVAVVASGVLVLVPPIFNGLATLRGSVGRIGAALPVWVASEKNFAIVTALAPVIFGLFAARLKQGTGKKCMTLLFALSGPLLALVVFLNVGIQTVGPNAGSPTAWTWVAGVTAALGLWGWLFVDLNEFSPHGYYRDRLCECYLAVRQSSQLGLLRSWIRRALHGREKGETFRDSGIGTLRKLPLSQMNATGAAPYHLVNTAVNLPASREPNLRGRDCDFFTFTRDYCGGPVCGYIKTATLERLDPHVDLGTAMAVSGAAASSNMGVKTMRHLRFLLTLLNVRLGYWLRNPLGGPRRWWNVPGPQYLLREMTGWMHEKTDYMNLSDGGHIENLALYEMLRRRCKFILVVDGGQEPGMECADLMLAQRYAQIDLGVRLELDLADLALDAGRRSRAYAVFGKVHYSARSDGTGADDLGWLVYLKLARTGAEPGYVVDYARQNPDFPHQTTGDQIYDEAQFEAYRRLGECAAESLFRPEISDPCLAARPTLPADGERPRFATLDSWFQSLAGSLLADNDEAFATDEIEPRAEGN